jgi:predicted PurR-regulated permease PerM
LIQTSSILKKVMLLFFVVAGLIIAKDFLIPIFIGTILATMLLPVCNWLERHTFNRLLAVITSFFILVLLIGFIASLLSWQVNNISNEITQIKEQGIHFFISIQKYILQHFNISMVEQSKLINEQQNKFFAFTTSMLGVITHVLTSFLLILIYVFLLLYYRSHLKKFILKISNNPNTETIISKVTLVSQQYLIGLGKMIFLLWIMYGIGFSILGVKNAIFFAILCGILEIVPFVGNITGTIITLLAAIVQGCKLPILAGIVITYGSVQFIQGWFLEPLFLGPQVKLNPLFTIIALLVGEIIWGIPGIILAIPVMAMVKIICDNIEDLHPIGFLLGEVKKDKIPEKKLNINTV